MKRSVSLPSPRYRVDKNGKLVQHNLMDPVEVGNFIDEKIMDQRKNLKWRVSLYFHSSFSPIYSPLRWQKETGKAKNDPDENL